MTREHGAMLVVRLAELDVKLVAAGMPALSRWWRETLTRFLLSGRRRLVLRVGRRGGKSSSLCRLAVVLALWGGHVIPPGDIGVVAFVSVRADEAARRLRTITKILDVLGVRHRPMKDGEGIELFDRPIGWQTFPATIGGVSGATCIVAISDEVAKWRDDEAGVNPASEVLSSLRAMLASQPLAVEVLSSSPVSVLDAHYDAFEEGETDEQCVAHAPTWVAHPAITEADTRLLERDPRKWRREYAAEPVAAVSAAFDADAVDRAFVPRALLVPRRRVLVIDASSGRKDAWTWGVCGWNRSDDGRGYLSFDVVDGYAGSFWKQTPASEVVDALAELCASLDISSVHGDQREAFALSSMFAAKGLTFVQHDWTAPRKAAAVEVLRRWFADGLISLPEHAQLRRELHSFEERITSSGVIRYAARGSGHDDFVALLLTAAMAELSGELHASSQLEFDEHYNQFFPRLRV